jgi:hypothetical protein
MDFSFLLGLLPGSIMGYVAALSVVIAGAALIASAISKLTANTTDDKIAAFLVKLHDLLVKLVPSGATIAQKRAPAVLPPTVHPKLNAKH